MRAAVLADIHGNLPALNAVLEEADVAGADTVVLLGNIALGPTIDESDCPVAKCRAGRKLQ